MKFRLYLVGLVFTFFVSVIVVTLIFQNNSKKKEYFYQISNFNVRTNVSSRGFVRSPNKILYHETDFITYFSSGFFIYSTISKISEANYECFGKCLCEDQFSRRSSAILSKSLFFFISTVSVSMAIKIASNFFHEECALSLSDCPKEFILSHVEFCEARTEKDVSNEEDYEVWDEKDLYVRKFHCEGHCVPNLKITHPTSVKKRDEAKCEQMVINGDVFIEVPPTRVGWSDYGQSKFQNDFAKRNFRKIYLVPFCKKMSATKVELEFILSKVKYVKNGKVYTYYNVPRKDLIEIRLCVGAKNDGSKSNIRCHLDEKHFRKNKRL